MATRRQRRRKGNNASPIEQHESVPPPHDPADRAGAAASGTPWERLGGAGGASPLAVLLVSSYVAVPAALGKLALPLFGPTRLVLEPIDSQLRVGAPTLLVLGVALLFGTRRLVQWLGVPERLATLFYLGAVLTTIAWGLELPAYFNAKLDTQKGYIQSLNGRTDSGELAGGSVFVTTALKPGVALSRSTFLQGCRASSLGMGARCRFTVRPGRLGLQWAEPNPDDGR